MLEPAQLERRRIARQYVCHFTGLDKKLSLQLRAWLAIPGVVASHICGAAAASQICLQGTHGMSALLHWAAWQIITLG